MARSLVALHATDPATVYLSLAARLVAPTVADIDRALYDDRTLLRMLGMRRTMFTAPVDVAPIIQAACTRAIAAQELAAAVPDLRKQILVAAGKDYAGVQGIATRILFLLSADGRIMRGRPRGSWISSQYRWSPADVWLPGGLPDCPTPEAQIELVRRWLVNFGPGTLADLKWWTGLTMGEVRRALHGLDTAEVLLSDGEGVVMADDTEPSPPVEPWVALLPALDATPMGYSERRWFLDPHGPLLFDRSGNIGPTIWSDGRIVGGWAQRKNGAIAYKVLEDIGSAAEKAVATAAERLGHWLGAVRVTPRFRTPLERELSG